jgi:hypothetical protein
MLLNSTPAALARAVVARQRFDPVDFFVER